MSCDFISLTDRRGVDSSVQLFTYRENRVMISKLLMCWIRKKPEVSRYLFFFFEKLKPGPHQGSDLISLGQAPNDSNRASFKN